MTQVDRSALVLHSAEQMFDLVNAVEAYPAFLPGCARTEVISRSEGELVATLYLAKGGLKYHFTTRNQLQRPGRMTLTLEEGPFSRLQGEWQFIALSEEACKVVLNLTFDFSNKLTSLAMSKLFEQLATTMVDAFVSRADQVYGG
ncbi:type II toxin-antitoxin system RatA family toxin [Marinobacterium arenosum]|uniref:type II toxin-antitoxin system RatA family toxin n=1 Tax=Marinobacterium arenosum TaxID=2862496 RepID=UPI001C97641B|nr:type II toxin-antitoxin system RatA family toxin [Marinobacterium arenosum]MBY4677373.1 type II toxin-antitoxin system RatA family toxin [Marinobacterium arenosum]